MNIRKSRIEKKAVAAIIETVTDSDRFDPIINTDDKIPLFDGQIDVYEDSSANKASLKGSIPIQIKGTSKVIKKESATYQCSRIDLEKYLESGGCLFFYVSIDLETKYRAIFYSILLPLDLKAILNTHNKNNQTISISLSKFPTQVEELEKLLFSYLDNSDLQAGYKEFQSIEYLEKIGITKLNFSDVHIINENNLLPFISATKNTYLYGKVKNIDKLIPIAKIDSLDLMEDHISKIKIGDHTYSKAIKSCRGDSGQYFIIGKGIKIDIDKGTIQGRFGVQNTLKEAIEDTSFFLDLYQYREIITDVVKATVDNINVSDIHDFEERLDHYKDLQQVLEYFGVLPDLEIKNLSDSDLQTIGKLIKCMKFNDWVMEFPKVTEDVIYSRFRLANLNIDFIGIKVDNGLYKIESFYSPQKIYGYYLDKEGASYYFETSQYALMKRTQFASSSNFNADVCYSTITGIEMNEKYRGEAINIMLEVLHAYDDSQRDDLLDLASKLCSWLKSSSDSETLTIMRINEYQILKRQRELTTKEKIDILKLADSETDISNKCACFLLLEDMEEANSCFSQMHSEQRNQFLTYPISKFGSLKTS